MNTLVFPPSAKFLVNFVCFCSSLFSLSPTLSNFLSFFDSVVRFAAMNAKQAKIRSILDREPLSIQNNALCFIEGDCLPKHTAGSGLQAFLQERLKKHGGLYYFLIEQISPVRAGQRSRRVRKQLLNRYGKAAVVVNYGSGPRIYCGRRDVVNTDIYAFDEVDVVADTTLPFKDGAVDLFLNIAVLEHMKQPEIAVSEMLRCLKTGGEVFAFAPFMQPVHAAPHDYRRWTDAGLRELFSGFDIIEIGPGTGPTSGMLWVLQEWVSVALSFGCPVLKDIVLLAAMLLTFPLKHLDLVLERLPVPNRVASGYCIHARKPGQGNS